MKGDRDFVDSLRDIVEHGEAAIEFVDGVPNAEALADDRRTFWAVIRALEVIGEAARHIPAEFRQKYPHVRWRGMTGRAVTPLTAVNANPALTEQRPPGTLLGG